jgi:hypothetical protein
MERWNEETRLLGQLETEFLPQARARTEFRHDQQPR